MTDINHRRKNKKPVNKRYGEFDYHNGYASPNNKRTLAEVKADNDKFVEETLALGQNPAKINPQTGAMRVGRTDYLDKSLHSWGRKCEVADKVVGASIGNDFTDGQRGMAHAVKGAKKFVRSRVRFHENAAVKKMITEVFLEDENERK